MGLLKISVIIALAVLMLSSGLMIAKLNAKAGVASVSVGLQSSSLDIGGSAGFGSGTQGDIGGETEIGPDYSQLAYKYYDLFVQNPNGTVSLDFSLSGSSSFGITGSTLIEEPDRASLNEYAKFLDNINQQVNDGTLYQGDDGNYYFYYSDSSSRTTTGGKNDVYIWSEKVWFLWIPSGYAVELSVQNSIVFGIVMDNYMGIFNPSVDVLQNLDEFRKIFENYVGIVGDAELVQKAYNILQQVIIVGLGIKSFLNYFLGSFGDWLWGMLSDYLNGVIKDIYNLIAKPMYNEAKKHSSKNDPINTVRYKAIWFNLATWVDSYIY